METDDKLIEDLHQKISAAMFLLTTAKDLFEEVIPEIPQDSPGNVDLVTRIRYWIGE